MRLVDRTGEKRTRTMDRRSFLGGALAAAAAPSVLVTKAFGAPEPLADDGFSLVVLPDTQNYAWRFPEIYRAQTQWIADNVGSHKIPLVLHVGDVTEHNTDEQWKVARDAHALMADRVPCVMLPGNHDLGPNGKSTERTSRMSTFFPPDFFRRSPTFGGFYDREPDRTENSFHRFEAGNRRWLVLALEFGPRNDVLRWAGEVVGQNPDRSVILVTHAYLRPDNTRFDRQAKVMVNGKERNKGLDNYPLSKSTDGFNDGEDIWQKLVSQHANFAYVISGHVCVTGHRADQGKHGNVVHQMVVDYQNQENGGNGFLRLMQFAGSEKPVHVWDYSPHLNEKSQIANTDFQL